MTIKLESLSADELRDVVEHLWGDVSELKSQCFLIHRSIEDMFVLSSAERDSGYVTLKVEEERTDATLWLAGVTLDAVRAIENRIDALFTTVEP